MELDFIRDPRFGVQQVSEAIINLPNRFGLLTGMDLFAEKCIDQTAVMIDVLNRGQINIIASTPRGSPVPKQTGRTQDMRALPTFRHALGDDILADQFQNVRAFGSTDQLEVFETRLMEVLDDLNWKHWQTTEYLRWAALRGSVLMPGGAEMYNVYTLMGEQQKEIEWDLEAASGDPIQAGTDELLDYLELNAFGEPIEGVVKFCSPGYFTKLLENAEFRKAYTYFLNMQGQPNPLRDNLRNGFFHKGITYLRHIGRASYMNADGTRTTSKFIPDDEAIAVPLGTRQVFRTYYAPADYIETVNTMGQRLYAKTDVMKMNRGIEVETQSQQLNIVLKPRLVVRCTIKA